MSTISLRVTEEDAKLIKDYAKVNGFNLSSFIRDTVIDAIEDDLNMDEERILNAYKRIDTEKATDQAEVWKKLGV